MLVYIEFLNNELCRPTVSVLSGSGRKYPVSLDRWIQFVCLLGYRRMRSIRNGVVEADELCNLIAFEGLKTPQVGAYLSNSHPQLSSTVRGFVKQHMEGLYSGPFSLVLREDRIVANLKLLRDYLQRITLQPIVGAPEPPALLSMAHTAKRMFNLKLAYQAYREYILNHEHSNRGVTPEYLSAYVHWIEVKKRLFYRHPPVTNLVVTLMRKCRTLKDPEMRSYLTAELYSKQALGMTKTDRSIPRIIRLNEMAEKSVKSLKVGDSRRIHILGARYYQKYLVSLSYGINAYHPSVYSEAKKMLNELDHDGALDLFRIEPGLGKIIELQLAVNMRKKAFEAITREELTWYRELYENPGVSPYMTLVVGKSMMENMISQRQFIDAYTFGTEVLIDHAEVHEAFMYHKLRSNIRELSKRLRGERKFHEGGNDADFSRFV